MFDMDGCAYHYHNVAYGGIALTVTWAGTRHEPPREFRRLIAVSHAAMADSVSRR